MSRQSLRPKKIWHRLQGWTSFVCNRQKSDGTRCTGVALFGICPLCTGNHAMNLLAAIATYREDDDTVSLSERMLVSRESFLDEVCK